MAHETSIGKAVGIVKKQLESTCKVVADIWNSDQATPANNLNLPPPQASQREGLLREVHAVEEDWEERSGRYSRRSLQMV